MPQLSVVIPAFERIGPLVYTLESLRRSIGSLDAEIIIVDDGSREPLAPKLSDFADLPLLHLRQENAGCVVAKHRGMLKTQGEYVQFLDSDDLVAPDKFRLQIELMEKEAADVCNCDGARVTLSGDFDALKPERLVGFADTASAAELYLLSQPAPHAPLFRRSYLMQHLKDPLIPPAKIFHPVGETWMYYNLCIHDAKVVKVPQPLAWSGASEEEQLTDNWERLGVAALVLMEEFTRSCPKTPETEFARRLIGERAFFAWRKLPRGFHREYSQRLLNVYRNSPHPPLHRLGGGSFSALAKLLGPIRAASLLRPIQRPNYESIRTMTDEDFASLMASSKAPTTPPH